MKRLYIDMDGVLVDFKSGMRKTDAATLQVYGDDPDDIPGIFALMDPMKGAIEAYEQLSDKYDTYILSTAPWNNPSAWSDKLLWVQKYLGEVAWKRLNISHHKNLLIGDYLIDDRKAHGVDMFNGEHIHFGVDPYPNWDAVLNYL